MRKRKYRGWMSLDGKVTTHCVIAANKVDAAVQIKKDFPEAIVGWIQLAGGVNDEQS